MYLHNTVGFKPLIVHIWYNNKFAVGQNGKLNACKLKPLDKLSNHCFKYIFIPKTCFL